MAQRRMFSLKIIETDIFLEMPQTSRLLYYELGMRADDDGFVSTPKMIMKITGCSEDDLKILSAKKYIIPFESGVIVIRHWNENNYIQNDRKHDTRYIAEKNNLIIDGNGCYELDTKCIQNVSKMDTEVRLGKDSIGKVRLDNKSKHVFIKPTIEEVINYFLDNGYRKDIAEKAFNYYDIADWHDSQGTKIKNWKQKMMMIWFKEENKISKTYISNADRAQEIVDAYRKQNNIIDMESPNE